MSNHSRRSPPNLPTPPPTSLRPGSQRVASRRGTGGAQAATSPASSSLGGSFSVADHQQDVDQVISQVTRMLQRRLVQHEASFEHALQHRAASTVTQQDDREGTPTAAPLRPPAAAHGDGDGRSMPPFIDLPPRTAQPVVVAGGGASLVTSPVATATTTAPSPTSVHSPLQPTLQPTPPPQGTTSGGGTTTMLNVPCFSAAGESGNDGGASSHPLGTTTVITASGEADGSAAGGAPEAQSFSRPTSPNRNHTREPTVELRSPNGGIRRRSTKSVGSRSPSLNKSPSFGADPGNNTSLSPVPHPLLRSGSDGFSALSGSSLPNHSVTLVASGMTSPAFSTSTSGPAIRPSPALSGMVFPSGDALVQHLNEGGSADFAPATSGASPVVGGDALPPPSAVPIGTTVPTTSPRSSRPSVISPAPSAVGKMSQTEKWKHRVSHIEGPVQLGSKETVFSVRSEIQSLHKKYPSDAKLLKSSMEANKKDLVQVFAIVSNKQYQSDTEELKGQLRRTDAQIDAELSQHAKMMDLLEGAVAMLDQASTTGDRQQGSTAPAGEGVGDVGQLSTEALRARMEQTVDPTAKKQLALRLFIRMSQEKIKRERSVAQLTATVKEATSSAVSADPREELLQRAKQLAGSVGLNLEAEARTLPQVTLDPASLAAVDEALMADAAAAVPTIPTAVPSAAVKPPNGIAPAAATAGGAGVVSDDASLTRVSSSIASMVNMQALARRMSSFRRANPVAPVIEHTPAAEVASPSHRGRDVAPLEPSALGASYPPTATASAVADHTPSHHLTRPKVAPERSVSPAAATSLRRVSSSLAPSASMSKSLTLRAGGALSTKPGGPAATAATTTSGAVGGGVGATNSDALAASASVVYTSAQRVETAAALAVSAATLRTQAKTAREVAEADYALRLQREADQAQRLKSRTMDQILRDAIDNRAPSPIEHITKEDLDRVLAQASDAENLADQMTALQKQTEDSVQLREELLGKAKFPLMAELRELEDRVLKNTAALHQAHLNRKNLVKQYWQWRQRVELGDVKAGKTFEEELERGPRFRHVGVQNVIQNEYLSQQVDWLRQLLRREQTFRRHVLRVESLVNELREVNLLVDQSLRCPVCQRICKDPVSLWPCGHSFCQACFETLSVSAYLHRCSVCFSVGSEGCLPNLLLSEIIAKWVVKEAGYANFTDSLREVKDHMDMFQRDKMQLRLNALEYRSKQIRDHGYLT